METGININGMEDMLSHFQKMVQDFSEEKLKLMNDAGDILVKHIEELTPAIIDPPDGYDHAPGKLKRSIKKKVKHGYAVVKSDERYAHLVEAGHVMRGHKPDRKVLQLKNGSGVLVKGKWMFKRGTKYAEPELHSRINEFARKVITK